MLDETAAQNFFNQMDQLYIQPEINQRKSDGNLTDDFKIRQCLIRLPQNGEPIVEFNDEFGWAVEHPTLAPGVKLEPGKPVYLHELVNLGKVLPPQVDDKQVAFVFLYWTGFSFQVVFDFSPNQPGFDADKDEFRIGEAIAQHLRLIIIEMTVSGAVSFQAQLQQIGLWPATSLLPYPISKIVERIGSGHLEEARSVLVSHCNTDFLEASLVNTWKPIAVYRSRLNVFEEAIFAHSNRKYTSAIYTLVPQIEGVITDWLYQILGSGQVDWKAESKIDQFHQQLMKIPQLEFAWRKVLDSTYQFLRYAQPMQGFKNWLDVIDPAFPGRHPVAHGKQVVEMFTEENSIKLFLLLDTICQFMMFYEVRVLGRDLGQNTEGQT